MTKDQLAILKARLDEAENEERIAFTAMLAGDISPMQAETAISARYVADAQWRYAKQLRATESPRAVRGLKQPCGDRNVHPSRSGQECPGVVRSFQRQLLL